MIKTASDFQESREIQEGVLNGVLNRITWAEFVEYSKKHSCPNCEIGEPEKCNDECMECYAAYVEWTVRNPNDTIISN